MAIYFAIFLSFLIPIFLPFAIEKKLNVVLLALCFLFLIIFVGLRSEVGGDWNTYLKIYNSSDAMDIISTLYSLQDPAFYSLVKLSNFLGWGIYGVNLAISSIFFLGLSALMKKSNFKLLFLVIAMPYLIFVVSMGYVRQAAALGVLMHLYAYINSHNPKTIYMLGIILVAFLFHKSAILLLPLALMLNFQFSFIRTLILIPIFAITGIILAYQLFLDYYHYATGLVQSNGAFIRQLMMLVPCLIFLRYRKIFSLYYDYRFLRLIVIIVISVFPLVFFASTAVDRALLYFYPIQMIILCRLPEFIIDQTMKALYIIGVCLAYFLALYVWMNFSDHAYLWLPYKFII